MSSTLLEVTRAWHEEVERLERLIVKDLQTEPPTNNDLLNQSHRVRNRIEQIMTTTHKLIDIYEDKDNARKDEIAALGGLSSTGATNVDVFSAFYDRLQEIRENQSPHPAARNVDTNDELLKEEEPIIEFTEEEAFGRYLDLHELYNDYINFNFGKQIEYSAYLDVFSEPERISPGKLKFTRQYLEYMRKLLEYLIYLFKRTEPLQDLERIFSKVIAEFEDQWSQGVVEGWENENQENGTIIDLDYYSTLEELMEVGPEKLTKALAALGLKTGGTVQERAERLLLTKRTRLEKLDEKHFAKGSCSAEQNGGAVARQPSEDEKEIALIEAKVKKLFGLLHEVQHGSGPVCSTSTQIKEHVNANSKLQEQLHEKDQKIHELERKMDDKDRELQALRLQIEAYKIGRSGVASTLGKLLPITHSAVHQNTTLGLEVLRSITFGGQLVSASAMSFVASASVASIGTSGIVHLGVGNATGGVVSIIYGLCELYRGRVDQSDSYVETLGRRDRWLLHTVAAIVSYLLCGLVAPLVYGFSFRESDNAIQKSLIAVGVSVPCILSMTALKYYVGGPPRDRTLAFLFIGSSVLASVISYFTVVLFG